MLTRRLAQSKSLPHPAHDEAPSSGNHFGGFSPPNPPAAPTPPSGASPAPALTPPLSLPLLVVPAPAAPIAVEEKVGVGFVVVRFHSFLRSARKASEQRAVTQSKQRRGVANVGNGYSNIRHRANPAGYCVRTLFVGRLAVRYRS